MERKKLTALVFGGTGAVGRELVKALLANNNWGRIICVVRRSLPEWEPVPGKLQIVKSDDLDRLQHAQKWQFPNVDVVFCCLGSRTGEGKQTFVKIDKTYPLWIADIAKSNKIRHYSLVSSIGSNPNSCFLYPRTKGQVEEELKVKGLPVLSIFKPGLLKGRHDARCIEKWAECCLPCFASINVREVAQVLILDAEKVAENPLTKGTVVIENAVMLEQLPR